MPRDAKSDLEILFLPLFQLKLLHHRSGDLENRGHLRDIEQACILQITLFVPIGTNISVIDAKADAIRAKFGTEQSHTVDGHNVLIRSSHKEPAMPDSDGKWYMQPISIEYQII